MKNNSRKSLLIVTQHFYPEIAATAQLMTDLATDLVLKGIEVTVLAAVPYYLASQDIKIPAREEYKGVHIIRVVTTRFNLNNVLGRIPNWLSFHFFVMFKSLFMSRPDVVLTLTIPPYIAFAGMLLKRLKGSAFMFSVQDVYPDVAVELGLIKDKNLIRFLQNLTIWNYKKADRIISIGEFMSAHIIKQGISQNKITVIHNWADGKELYPITKEKNPFLKELGLENKFVISYSGNFGIVHDFEPIKKAMMDLQGEKDIVFLFIGDGTEKKKVSKFVEDSGIKNTMFLPFQPREKILYTLNACDVSLVTIKRGMEGKLVPSKLYGILAVGKPVIGICSKNCEVAIIIEKNKCGLVAEDNDLSSKILALYRDQELKESMGRNGLNAFVNNYDRVIATDKYYSEIIKLCKGYTE